MKGLSVNRVLDSGMLICVYFTSQYLQVVTFLPNRTDISTVREYVCAHARTRVCMCMCVSLEGEQLQLLCTHTLVTSGADRGLHAECCGIVLVNYTLESIKHSYQDE